MKGEQAEYRINLTNAFMFPPKKRIRKALNEILKFSKKHTRAKETLVSNEVNNYLHKNSKNIPRKVDAILLKEGDKTRVFLKDGKELKVFLDHMAKAKKQKEEKKKAKESKKEGKGAEEEKEKKEKLEEKKAKEEAQKASDIKRKA